MKSIGLVVLLATLGVCATPEATRAKPRSETPPAATASSADAPPAPEAPSPEHAWLQQLVGEWSFACKATMGEGAAPIVMEGTESVRSIGGLWIVAEGLATVDGQPMQSVLTLGYQPEQTAFIGTWLDGMQTHLWSYTGHLDAGRTTLTLDTEGPSFDDPGKTSHYRDAIELKDKDHKVLTSSVQGADGAWTTFMRAEYQRTK